MIAYIVAVFIVKRIEMFIPVILFTVLITVLAKVPANYMLKALKPMRLLLPLMFALLFLFALGVTLVMATLNVFFRDTRFLWSVISLLWTYATPIFYPDTIWPEGLRGIFHLIPMYQLIDFLRQIVIAGIPPTPERLLACAAGAFGMLMIGLVIFRRYEKKFVFHL